jgi:Protein of unknown function (DUF3592)
VTRISIMKYVFMAFGMLFMTIAVSSAKNTREFVSHASIAQGTVIDLVRRQTSDAKTFAPLVRFTTADGETIEFTSATASNPPGYAKGDGVAVLYRPLAPRDARIDGFASLWAGPLMFGGLGSITFLVGASVLLNGVRKTRDADDLKRHGKRLLTTVQRVEMKENLKVNGCHPYRIFTQCKNSPEMRIFESDYVWFDPSPYLNGRNITVFIAPADPTRYYVDLSFLPKSLQRARASRVPV